MSVKSFDYYYYFFFAGVVFSLPAEFGGFVISSAFSSKILISFDARSLL